MKRACTILRARLCRCFARAGKMFLGSVTLDSICRCPGYVVWNESRPLEGGRGVLVRAAVGEDGTCGVATDITPAGFNVRTLVHEYGGGEFLVSPGAIFFANMADQRLYRQLVGEGDARRPPCPCSWPPQALTAAIE